MTNLYSLTPFSLLEPKDTISILTVRRNTNDIAIAAITRRTEARSALEFMQKQQPDETFELCLLPKYTGSQIDMQNLQTNTQAILANAPSKAEFAEEDKTIVHQPVVGEYKSLSLEDLIEIQKEFAWVMDKLHKVEINLKLSHDSSTILNNSITLDSIGLGPTYINGANHVGLRICMLESAHGYLLARKHYLNDILQKAKEQLKTVRTTWVPETFEESYKDVVEANKEDEE